MLSPTAHDESGHEEKLMHHIPRRLSEVDINNLRKQKKLPPAGILRAVACGRKG